MYQNTRGVRKMVLGMDRKEYQGYGIKIPVNITLPKKTSNLLIAGKSGSGKSISALWYVWQLLHTQESAVYLSDYKAGEEYEMLEGVHAYSSGTDAIQTIRDFYQFFTEIRNSRIRLKKHYTLFIEEWSGLLAYVESQDKKLKTELMSEVGELLAVSRGLNMGVFVCVQRADASYFSSGSREQFQCVLSFGRCSAEQFRMLGFSGEMEENPTGGYQAGQALALIDGQEEPKEIIVPWIRNSSEMREDIRRHLEHQTDLRGLIEAVAEGRSGDL